MRRSTIGSAADLCAEAALLSAKYSPTAGGRVEKPVEVDRILRALDEFMELVRYLNTRRTAGAALELTSEAAVQDALYLMLRPWVLDLVPENPTDRIANRYTIKDFLSAGAKCVVEAKYIRDRDHGKGIAKEIHDDIETYRHHASCRHLIFFIYDPDALIPDRAALARQVHTKRIYDGVPLDCYLTVKP